MEQTLTTKIKKKKGFTLIELIVVIAILGILAAVAIPKLAGFQDKAKISSDKATFATLNSAIAAQVADGTIKDDVTVTITKGTGVITTDPTGIIESGSAFKVSGNVSAASGKDTVLTWTVENGAIKTAPTIDETTGVITP